MYIEVSVAVNYVISYLYNKLPRRRVDMFGGELDKHIKMKFHGHWHPDQPLMGASHRCVRVSGDHTDSVMFEAARECGLDIQEIFTYLPEELTLWVDPNEVSYRIGDKGQVKILYSENSKEGQELTGGEEVESAVVTSNGNFSPDFKTIGENLTTSFGQLALSPGAPQPPPQQQTQQTQQQQQQPSWSASPSPTNVPGYSGVTVPVPPINSYLQKSSSTPNFTAASFAQTKFGSTKLKAQSKRPSRLSPSEMGAYVKQRQHVQFPGNPVNRSISLSPSSTAPPGLEIPLFLPNRASPILNSTEPFPGYLSIQIPTMETPMPNGTGAGPRLANGTAGLGNSEPSPRLSSQETGGPGANAANPKHDNFSAPGFNQYLLVAN